ncbi:MAG: tRNA lysidine(34) synthetase TilS [Oscillospiraceae bacterium]|nr:tRNA lysidine(34) synthetase TilS [Oscillospiraceae bacterium]
MLNKLGQFIEDHKLLQPGDCVVCAVSGGADSVALLFALYLLKEKLQIKLSAAHFNHHLRGAESDRDEAFVRDLCDRYDIPLQVGSGEVVPGKKGLEAAARDARYGFLKTLPGKIATAHTADDNAETVLMRMVRGTGLKGLGAIAPVNGKLIRPMLTVTRKDVLAFLQEYALSWVEDSSNGEEDFLRNRLRHQVLPLLTAENPRFAENTSALALRLQQDEAALAASVPETDHVETLRSLPPALRSRALAAFLERCGVREPEAQHILLAEKLVFSPNPSAKADLPGNVTVARNYGRLVKLAQEEAPEAVQLPCPGTVVFGGYRISCAPAASLAADGYLVQSCGSLTVRSRRAGDAVTLPGGTKSLKKLFIDRKIPADLRETIPVVADDAGVVCVIGVAVNKSRAATRLPAIQIRFEKSEE